MIAQELILMIFEGTGCHTGNKAINFHADLDHEPEPGILSGIFTNDLLSLPSFLGR